MIVDTEQNIPIKYWLKELPEDGAISQAKDLARLPFAFHHIAIMPDTHEGYGMPIGGVLATHQVIIPNAVGVDIGCGMVACRTSLSEIDIPILKKIMGDIRLAIPVGFDHHKEIQFHSLFDEAPDIPIIQQELNSARHQLGTLGGGNHFIEIQSGDDGHIWIMIHSGSRNFGFKTADIYHKKAVELCDKWYANVPKDLSFLPIDSQEGQEYLEAMNYSLRFALANRQLMLERVRDIMFKHIPKIKFDDEINIHHNYAQWENHFGQNVIVHRKGATSARLGERGIIPGSMGTKSYIVEGLGNPESFQSCSHGAGRRMGRAEAKRSLNLAEQVEKLEALGVIHGLRTTNELDEAPDAYKDIDEVMDNQKDLVKILVELTPLAVIKG